MSLYTAEERAEARRRRAEERAARQRDRETERLKRERKKRSEKVMAKWYQKGSGCKISNKKNPDDNIIVRGGLYYAGVNMAALPHPEIDEPSLINPVYDVAFDSNGRMPLVGKYLGYASMKPEQRYAYLNFLATGRKSANDIAYPLIYLYGLERRLIVDADAVRPKTDPNTGITSLQPVVTDEERNVIVDELLRMLRCFREQSKSFEWYSTLLLLYDGTVFKRGLDEETIRDLFMREHMQARSKRRRDDKEQEHRRFTWCDDTDAYEYMLLTRLAENGIKFPEHDLLNYCRARLFRGNKYLDFTPEDMYRGPASKASYKLMRRRYRSSSLNREYPLDRDMNVSRGSKPEYVPGSMPLIKAHVTDVSKRMTDLEATYAAPYRQLSDLALTCYREVSDYLSIMENKSLRGIEDVNIDVIRVTTKPKMLDTHLKQTRQGIAIIPQSLLANQLRAIFNQDPQYTSKGLLTAQTQHAYSQLLASLGWQAVLPVSFDDKSMEKYLRIKEGDDIVAFDRQTWFGKNNGVQHLGNIFGAQDFNPGFAYGDRWDNTFDLIVIYVWLLKESGEKLSFNDTKRILSRFKPALTKNRFPRQVMAMYATMRALYVNEISQMAVKDCLRRVTWIDAKTLVFSWCQLKHGRILPEKVMDALSKLYVKASVDKGQILYDYHSANYSTTDENVTEFVIDDERLHSTIASTSSVHTLLNDAISDADDDDEDDMNVIGGHAGIGEIGNDDDAFGEYDANAIDDDDIREELDDTLIDGWLGDFLAEGAKATPTNDNAVSVSQTKQSTGDASAASERIEKAHDFIVKLYGDADTDEMVTSELQKALMDEFGLETTASALSLLSDVNAAHEAEAGEPLVDIDGADAYINL